MKKIIWASIVSGVILFTVISKDPLNEAVNFLLTGTIPGTNLSIGFWSTMLVAVVALLLIYRGIKNAHHRMIVAQIEKKESTAHSSPMLQEVEFDRTQRSVIAAPTREPTV